MTAFIKHNRSVVLAVLLASAVGITGWTLAITPLGFPEDASDLEGVRRYADLVQERQGISSSSRDLD